MPFTRVEPGFRYFKKSFLEDPWEKLERADDAATREGKPVVAKTDGKVDGEVGELEADSMNVVAKEVEQSSERVEKERETKMESPTTSVT